MKNIENVPKEYVMKVSGREHVTFDGLVHMAHAAGLVGTDTELLQAPSADNSGTAIVRAVATFEQDGKLQNFSGIGDANALNTNKQIAVHCIRMAETRALARALRVALNIKGCALEELGGDVEAEPAPKTAPKAAPAAKQVLATESQAQAIRDGMKAKGLKRDDVLAWTKKHARGVESTSDLTEAEAQALVAHINGLPAKEAA